MIHTTLRWPYTAILLLLCLLSGCGGFDGEIIENTYYVDSGNGSDTSGDGTVSDPFKTITYALQYAHVEREATGSITIYLEPGTYNTGSGEVFPLNPNIPVSIANNTVSGGEGSVTIDGVGSFESTFTAATENAGVLCGAGINLDGITLTATGGAGLWCESGSFLFKNGKIINSDKGSVSIDAFGRIINSLIDSNTSAGLEIHSDSEIEIGQTDITNNAVGVYIADAAKVKIGTPTEKGLNTLTGNTNCDLWHNGSEWVYAVGNTWDDDVSSFTVGNSCAAGENIANTGLGAVFFQYIPISGSAVFPGRDNIELAYPEKGALLTDQSPPLAWVAPNSPLTVAAIFQNKIDVSANGKITNTSDIVWLWHSGLSSGRAGAVEYSEGKSVNDDDLVNVSDPVPLEKGRTYYWIVWAWDSEGKHVKYSSAEYDFTILN